MTDHNIICYESMPLAELRAHALRRADEVDSHDDVLFMRLIHLGYGIDGDEVDASDYDLLRQRPDIPRWTPTDTGVTVTLGGAEARVGRQA